MTRQKLNKVLALALAVILSVGLLPTQASAATADFSDVPSYHWAYADVMWARSHGVVDGVGNNRFDPDSDVSHAQMIKMLCDAFLADEYAAYEAAHRTEIEQIFGGASSWYTSKAYYFAQNELLQNVSVVIADPSSANAAMNRYDMAQILSNVLSHKDKTATNAQKSAAQAAIGDFSGIPGAYRDAVLTTYALGIINGEGGKFNGNNNMTRAQACAVIHRVDNLLNGGAGNDPKPVTPTVKNIEITTKTTAYGTGYYVADNKCGDGYLNNGKSATVENVIELLHEAEKIWPAGLRWTYSGTTGNNWYQRSSDIMDSMLSAANTGTQLGLNSNYACGGYAAMISDYLFGSTNNNYHRVTDVTKIQPGDIIVEINTSTNSVIHVMVAVTANGGAYTGQQGTTVNYRDGYIHCTDGNASDKVSWPNLYSAPQNLNTHDANVAWQVYSRYPETGSTPAPTPTPGPVDPAPSVVTPKPTEPTVKDIVITTTATTTYGTGYYVADNKCGDGYLNNGKPITTENVIELLHEAEKIWPTGIKWTNNGALNNNWYQRSSDIMDRMFSATNTGDTQGGLDSNYACGGFAAMISDYVFGSTNNNFHRVTNVNDIRPGDIIVEFDTANNTVKHAMVAVTASGGAYAGQQGTTANYRDGYIHCVSGNASAKVSWPNPYSAPRNINTHDANVVWQVYSRYPV